MTPDKSRRKKICLLGAAFDTSNMGVSALAASTVKCIVDTYPNASVILLDHGENDGFCDVKIASKCIRVKLTNTSFSKRIWRSNHYLWQLVLAVLYRFLAIKKLRNKIIEKSNCLRAILESDACLDASGGDSFGDTYGLYRLLYVFSYKLLVLLLQKKLFLLPQTYGPFEKPIAKVVAKHIFNKATVIYSRDQAGVEYVRNFLSNRDVGEKVRFAPDVAFILDPNEPAHAEIDSLESLRTEYSVLVGVNVSGLLFNGGYARDNMFSLKIDYRQLINSIVGLLMKERQLLVLLVPHVFAPLGDVESDPDACLQVYNTLREKFKSRLFPVQGQYDQGEIKYLIGMCDFFIGSRMHSCIAALSQGISTIGLAYSKKFRGVFETVGAEQLVVDMRQAKAGEILTTIAKAFGRREVTSRHLNSVIPGVQQQILDVFASIP